MTQEELLTKGFELGRRTVALQEAVKAMSNNQSESIIIRYARSFEKFLAEG